MRDGFGKTPLVWAIGGSDCSGGAGLQADLKTVSALGAHACTVVTAVTAQNTEALGAAETVSGTVLAGQLELLRADLPPRAVKLGMLGDPETVRVIAQEMRRTPVPWIGDPVIWASAGAALISDATLAALKAEVFPHLSLLTPNLPEAAHLVGYRLENAQTIARAAEEILAMGVGAVVIKGGHGAGAWSQDYFRGPEGACWLTSPRLPGPDVRGTGCAFAAAVATASAFDYSLLDAVVIAKTYVNQCLRGAAPLGRGRAMMSYRPWSALPSDFPWGTPTAEQGTQRPIFPDCGPEPLGFYPVVDRCAWLGRLLPLGVKTAQLRIKDLHGAALENEIRQAIVLARDHGCRLFINDYWQMAMRMGAYGVHLGQEDLASADVARLVASGLRLGLSTHSYAEIARAQAVRPSYLAIGPIYPTTLKAMAFAPQGLPAFARWRKMLTGPVVAIGGIRLEDAQALWAAGADGIAVVSDITKNPDPEHRARDWLQASPRAGMPA